MTDDWPLLLGNTAGMDQKDSIFVVGMALAYAWLVLLVSLVPLCSLLSWSGPDAPHHGQYPPEGLLFSGLVLLVILHLTLCSFPVVRPLMLVGSPAGRSASWPVWTRRMLCVAVQKTADFRSRSSSQVVDFLLRCRGLFPWSCCSADHRVSPVAPVHVVDVPVMQVVQLPRWFAVLGHADDMPVVGNNRCLELDSVENLQRFRSCSSSMVVDFLVWDVDMPAVGQSLALTVQTVQMLVEVPQVLYLDKDVLMPVIARSLQYRNPWSSHRCCSGTRMWTCSLLCQRGFWSRRAGNSGDSAVAVLHQGCGHARRCAMTVASLDVQKTAEVSAVAVHGVTG